MRFNRKVIFRMISVLLLFIVLVTIQIIKQKSQVYNEKLISIMNKQERATVQDVFSFEFERAYVFNVDDGYIDGENFAKKYNLDISINQVEPGEADYIQRIVFVDESGSFVYEFKCIMDEVIFLEKGVIIYPETIIERESSSQEKPITINFESSERYCF